MLGMAASRLVPDDTKDEVRRREGLALSGEPQRYECQVLRADGERRTVAVSTAPLVERGEISGIVASLRDVTEERPARAAARVLADVDGGGRARRGAARVARRARDAVAQSEGRYRHLFESASDAIYTMNLRGAFTSLNDAAEEMSGHPRAAVLGQNSRFIFDDEGELERVREQFHRALAGKSVRYECHFRRADGERRLVSVTNTPLRHGTEIIGVLGIARDVTDERARAAALARSEARYTRLVESASDAIFAMDAAGRFTAVNHALEQAVGQSRKALIGATLERLVDQRDVATAESFLNRTFDGERCRGSPSCCSPPARHTTPTPVTPWRRSITKRCEPPRSSRTCSPSRASVRPSARRPTSMPSSPTRSRCADMPCAPRRSRSTWCSTLRCRAPGPTRSSCSR